MRSQAKQGYCSAAAVDGLLGWKKADVALRVDVLGVTAALRGRTLVILRVGAAGVSRRRWCTLSCASRTPGWLVVFDNAEHLVLMGCAEVVIELAHF